MAPKYQDLALKLVAVSGAERPIILRLCQDRVELRADQKSRKVRKCSIIGTSLSPHARLDLVC